MMLGKRGRHSLKKTTSMSSITFDFGETDDAVENKQNDMLLSSRYFRKNSSSSLVVETPDFLRSCGLCCRRLAPGRDIYMYRGDTAFCSLECREQQMKQDERMERSAAATAANNGESHHSQIAATGKSGTAVAA